MLLKIALAVCLFLVSGGCTAKHATQADIPYKTYANVSMTNIGVWTRTDIHVPKGAMVAIMAEGECLNVKQPMKKRLRPERMSEIQDRGKRVAERIFQGFTVPSMSESSRARGRGLFTIILPPS